MAVGCARAVARAAPTLASTVAWIFSSLGPQALYKATARRMTIKEAGGLIAAPLLHPLYL